MNAGSKVPETVIGNQVFTEHFAEYLEIWYRWGDPNPAHWPREVLEVLTRSEQVLRTLTSLEASAPQAPIFEDAIVQLSAKVISIVEATRSMTTKQRQKAPVALEALWVIVALESIIKLSGNALVS